MRLALAFAILLLAPPLGAAELPPGPFDEAACIACHGEQSPDLVQAWRLGRHGPDRTGCTACHGLRHGALAAVRQNGACVTCHGGPTASPVRAYATSKHGVIAGLEAAQEDFSLPLTEGNMRAPTCAYCHLHEADHGASAETEHRIGHGLSLLQTFEVTHSTVSNRIELLLFGIEIQPATRGDDRSQCKR